MAAVDDVQRRSGATGLEVTIAEAPLDASMPRRRHHRVRLIIMPLGMLALLGALWGGLVRLGWPVPSAPALAEFHGPLMVAGFLGTVIGLERAVALGRLWTYAAPLASSLGAVALAAGAPGGPWLMTLAVWLGIFDIARRTVWTSGLTRFIAVALLSGYVWLGVAGLLALCSGQVSAGRQYDAILHALFLGFVFSMIFGHAPIIFPAVLGLGLTYRPTFYLHLGLLHASLALRVFGDLVPWLSGRQWGGLLNSLAIVIFFANTAYGVLGPRPLR